MTVPAVNCQAVTKIFRHPFSRLEIEALREISFEIDQGDFVCVLGRNGSGKSTLLRIIAGIARPSEGKIFVFGQDPRAYQCRRQIGYMPEKSQFYLDVSAETFLNYIAKLHKIISPEKNVLYTIELVGLKKWAQIQIKTYSVGMKQRLALASALIHSPQLILLDEPMANIDKEGKKTMQELLTTLIDEKRTVIVATHDTQLTARANRCVNLE
ncbi:MAG: ABC transporter ATP-binding protein [Promethearchaeota archaeon]